MNRALIWLSAFLVMAMAVGHAQACGDSVPIDAVGRVFMGPQGAILPIARFPARQPAYIRLGAQRPGDHWDVPPKGENELVRWELDPPDRRASAVDSLKIRLWGKREGRTVLPTTYVQAAGGPVAIDFVLIILLAVTKESAQSC